MIIVFQSRTLISSLVGHNTQRSAAGIVQLSDQDEPTKAAAVGN